MGKGCKDYGISDGDRGGQMICGHRIFNIFISPIKAIIHELDDQSVGYILFLRRARAADDLFLCCDSGESRSAAIAAAVLLSQNQSDLYIWNSTEYHPNHYVFKLQCAALGVNIDDEEIFMRRKLNDDAFHRAILNNDTSGG